MPTLRQVRHLPVFTGTWMVLALGWAASAVPPLQIGEAKITSPSSGAVVKGVVEVYGTAVHPQFRRFELAFAYDPNPTGVWFSIGETAPEAVAAGILGRWDTGGIADGTYALRLRVYWSERDYIEDVVTAIRVENEPDSVPATATPVPAVLPAITATATRMLIELPPTSTPRPAVGLRPTPAGRRGVAPAEPQFGWTAIRRAFFGGILLTVIGFGLLGVYAGLRAWLRSHRV